MISRQQGKRSILIETDSNGDGVIDDFLWVNAKEEKVTDSQLLFNEMTDEKYIPVEQIWYGPKNFKLIGKIDLDKDGFLESTVYYNYNAAPKITKGIIARIEVDSNRDGKINYWIYPGLRIEADHTASGSPSEFTENPDIISEIIQTIESKKKWEKPLSPLNPSKSFALYPDLIPNETNRAIIPKPY